MILKPEELLLGIANDEAKALQKARGREEKGIISTQVAGLAIALGKMFDKFPELAKVERIQSLDTSKTYIFQVPAQFSQEDKVRLRGKLFDLGLRDFLIIRFELKYAEKENMLTKRNNK